MPLHDTRRSAAEDRPLGSKQPPGTAPANKEKEGEDGLDPSDPSSTLKSWFSGLKILGAVRTTGNSDSHTKAAGGFSRDTSEAPSVGAARGSPSERYRGGLSVPVSPHGLKTQRARSASPAHYQVSKQIPTLCHAAGLTSSSLHHGFGRGAAGFAPALRFC